MRQLYHKYLFSRYAKDECPPYIRILYRKRSTFNMVRRDWVAPPPRFVRTKWMTPRESLHISRG